MAFYHDLTQGAPDELTVYMSLFANPDTPEEAMLAMAARSYSNNLIAEDGLKVREVWGANYQRLVTVKRCYDPGNVFRLNHNIDPLA